MDPAFEPDDQLFTLAAELPGIAERPVEEHRGEHEDRDMEQRSLGDEGEAERGGAVRGDGEIRTRDDDRGGDRPRGTKTERPGGDDDRAEDERRPEGFAREQEHRGGERTEIAGERRGGDAPMLRDRSRAGGGPQRRQVVRHDERPEGIDTDDRKIGKRRPEHDRERGGAPADARDRTLDLLGLDQETVAHAERTVAWTPSISGVGRSRG